MMTSRNHKFFMGKYRSFLTATAILYGAFAAQADYSDENIATTDESVRRLEVGGKSVYVFTNAASALTVTAKRGIVLSDCLLVGGGGGGGHGRAGGGGGGGVTNVTDIVGAYIDRDDTFTLAVGAGGAGGSSNSVKGGNGGETSLRFGLFDASIRGGGGGGSWGSTAGARALPARMAAAATARLPAAVVVRATLGMRRTQLRKLLAMAAKALQAASPAPRSITAAAVAAAAARMDCGGAGFMIPVSAAMAAVATAARMSSAKTASTASAAAAVAAAPAVPGLTSQTSAAATAARELRFWSCGHSST